MVDFRGADPPPCDIGTGRESRWRLLYDVYQYFLPENDLTEDGLLKHLQRMAEVPQVEANAVKVNLVLSNLCGHVVAPELRRGKATGSIFLYCVLGFSGILTLFSFISLSSG